MSENTGKLDPNQIDAFLSQGFPSMAIVALEHALSDTQGHLSAMGATVAHELHEREFGIVAMKLALFLFDEERPSVKAASGGCMMMRSTIIGARTAEFARLIMDNMLPQPLLIALDRVDSAGYDNMVTGWYPHVDIAPFLEKPGRPG